MNRHLRSCLQTRLRGAVVAMLVASVLAGCSGNATAGGSASTMATSEGRVAAIEAARDAITGPVTDLVDAAGGLASLADQWRANPTTVDLPGSARGPLAAARRASAAARDALGAPAGPDVAAADEVVHAMADLLEEQADVLAGLRADEAATRPVDELGAEFVERINDRGSRTPQRLAMEALVGRVDALVPAVDRRLGASTCPAPVRARSRALEHMRAVAQELGHLATTGQGTAFDALRAEATADPFDEGTTDQETVASITNCPGVAVILDTPRELVATVEELESALNPPDLVAD